jgi:hypothetical protein
VNEEKCIGEDCEKRGVPRNGYSFFVCEDCLEELDAAIIAFAILNSVEATA